MQDRVTIDVRDGVADVRLVRADKMNALDDAMFDALVAATATLAADARVRVVVLSGEGRAFCAGLDMGRFAAMGEPGGEDAEMRNLGRRTHGIANRPQQAVLGWRQLPVPVIAAVHGAAFGGGFQLMLGADLRYVAPDAKLSIMEIKWGLVPDMAGTVLLPGLMRDDQMRELTYTGRVFSGEEALTLGLATRIVADPRAAALATAAEIADKSPDAIRAAKRLFNAGVADVAAALQAESDEQMAVKGRPNQIEAVKANLEKRKPRFQDA